MAQSGNSFAKAICEVLGIDNDCVSSLYVLAEPGNALRITLQFHPNISDDDMYNIKETVEESAKVIYVSNL